MTQIVLSQMEGNICRKCLVLTIIYLELLLCKNKTNRKRNKINRRYEFVCHTLYKENTSRTGWRVQEPVSGFEFTLQPFICLVSRH